MFKNIVAELKELNQKKNSGFRGFMIRFSIFMGVFSFLSVLYPYYKDFIGQSFYGTNGGFYKLLFFFLIIIFIAAHKEKIEKSYPYRNKISETIGYAILSIISYSIPFEFLSSNFNINPIVASYLLYSLGSFCIVLSIFNSIFILKYMQEEFLKLILIIIAYFSAPLILQNLWWIIFEPIKIGVNISSSLINKTVIITNMEQGFMIHLKDFIVGVGPACSGIQSIIAFSALFASALVFLKKDKKIAKNKAIKIYLFGVSLLYLLNIIRVLTLIYVGAYVSEELSINLFHEYMSSVIFLFFFMVFIKKYSNSLFENNQLLEDEQI